MKLKGLRTDADRGGRKLIGNVAQTSLTDSKGFVQVTDGSANLKPALHIPAPAAPMRNCPLQAVPFNLSGTDKFQQELHAQIRKSQSATLKI